MTQHSITLHQDDGASIRPSTGAKHKPRTGFRVENQQSTLIHTLPHGPTIKEMVMSDQFDGSSDMEAFIAPETVAPTEPSGKMLTVDKFMSRPISSGNDVDVSFHIIPKQPTKKLGTMRSRSHHSLQILPSAAMHETTSVASSSIPNRSIGIDVDTRQLEPVTEQIDGIDVPDSSTFVAPQVGKGLPRSIAANIEEVADNAAHSHETSQEVPQSNSDAAKSNSTRPSPQQGSEKAVFPSRDGSNNEGKPHHAYPTTEHQQVETKQSLSDKTLADCMVSHKATSKFQEQTPPRDIGNDIPQNTPVHRRFRVEKSSSTPRQARKHQEERLSQGSTLGKQLPMQQVPSEDQLLLILLYRSRSRIHESQNDHEQIQALLKSREGLQHDVIAMKEQIELAQAERDDMETEMEMTHDELNIFRNKYRKLKNWALEMNKEYATIRQEGEYLRTSISTLKAQGQELITPLRNAITSSTDACSTVADVKNQLDETRQLLAALQGSFHEAKIELAEKSAELRVLKLKEQEHSSLAKNAFNVLRGIEKSTSFQQTRILTALNEFSRKLEGSQVETNQTEEFRECIRVLKECSAQVPTSASAIRDLGLSVVAIAEQLDVMKEALESSRQPQSEVDLLATLSKDVSTVMKMVQSLQPDMVEFGVLQQVNAKLQERTNGDAAIRQIVEDGKRTAETRAAEVQSNNNKLIESITLIKGSEEKRVARDASDLHEQIGTITIERNRAIQQLADANTKLNSCKSEIVSLKDDLNNHDKKSTTNIKSLQTSHDEHVLALEAGFDTKYAQIETEYLNQLKHKDDRLAAVTKASEESCTELRSSQAEAQDLASKAAKHIEYIQLLQNQAKTQAQDLEHQVRRYGKLSKDYEAISSVASRIPCLEHESADKDIVIRKLEIDAKRVASIQKEIEQTKEQVDAKDVVIIELKQNLAKTEESATERSSLEQSKRAELERLLRECRDQNAAQQLELFSFKEKSAVYNKLEEAAQHKDRDINRLHSLLEDARSTNKRLQSAEQGRQLLEQQIIQLQTKASRLDDLQQQIAQLETLNVAKEKELADQKHMLSSMNELESELQTLRKQFTEKEAQLIAKDEEIKELEAHCALKSQNEIVESNDLNGLFTQNTTLSIPAHTNLDDTEFESNQPSHISDTQEGTQLNTVDPRMTMRSISLSQIDTTHEGNAELLSQPSLIPDSQEQSVYVSKSTHHTTVTSAQRWQRTSSPLSDIDEDILEEDREADIRKSTREKHREDGAESGNDIDDNVFDVLSSPHNMIPHEARGGLSRRPSSIASQESMLLQASESGYTHSPWTDKAQRSHLRLKRAHRSAQSKEDTQIGSTRSSRGATGAAQYNIDTLEPVQADSRSEVLPNGLRQSIRPNSAAKRTNDLHIAAELHERSGSKRLKLSARRSDSSSNSQLQKSVGLTQSTLPIDDLSTNSRGGTTTVQAQTGFKKPTKKSQTSRTRSRQDKYADRFGGSSQS